MCIYRVVLQILLSVWWFICLLMATGILLCDLMVVLALADDAETVTQHSDTHTLLHISNVSHNETMDE